MKKLFIVALAAFGMVACMNEEITEMPNGGEISFDNAFIDNATRAELTAENLGEFKVWGYIADEEATSQTVTLFEGDKVSNETGAWKYEGGARYWAPGWMHYFEAVAPLTDAVVVNAAEGNAGKIATIDYTVDGESDLIYAAYNKEGNTDGSDNGAVAFGFDHLLSRIMFTFNNGFATEDGITLTVKDVKMTVPAEGQYNVEKGEWTVNTNTTTTLTDIEGAKFVLPYGDSYAYNIEFKVDVTYKGVVINKDVQKKSTVMVALEKGNSYNFTATIDAESLNMESIEFIVGEVNGWTDTDLPYDNATFYVKNVEELQAALDYAATGVMTKAAEAPVATTIFFANDITGDVTIKEVDSAPYHNITIDGREFKYDGKMSIQGNSNQGKGKLLIKNVNFESETEGREFIWCADSQNGSIWRYGNNITIEDCTFTANGAAVHTAVGAKFQQCYNIKLTNCVATNMHSLLQAESCGTTVTVEKSKVVNGKNGVSFNNTMNAIISNTEIESVFEGGYGIRHKGEVNGYALTVENCKVSAFAPVLVRNMKADEYTLTFKGTNELTSTNAFDIDVVLSATDYSEDHIGVLPNAPTGKYTIEGNVENFKVFPDDVLMQDAAALQEAINAGGYVVLGDDVEIAETLTITNDVTLDLQGKTIAGGFAKVDGVSVLNIAEGATLTIKNGLVENDTVNGAATIINNGTLVLGEGAEIVGAPIDENGYPEYAIIGTGKLTIEEGATVCSDRGALRLNDGADVTINGGNIYVTDALGTRILTSHVICAYEGAKVTIKGGDFTSYYPNTSDCGASVICPWGGDFEIYGGNFTYVGTTGQGGCFQNYMGAGSTVNVYGGTYSDNSVTKWIADGYHAVAQGDKYYVVKEEITAVAGSNEELKAAVGTNNAVIELVEGNYTMPSISNNEVTIKGTEDTVITVNTPNCSGGDVTFEGVTIKGSGYATGVQHVNTVTYNDVTIDGTMCLYGEKVVFNGCDFKLHKDYIWTYGVKEVEFNNCTFNCDNSKAILIYNEGAGATKATVKGCTFIAAEGAKAGAIANQNCAAIEIDNSQTSRVGTAHELITEGNNYDSNFSGEWRIKTHMVGNPITVNGVEYTQIAIDGKLMTIDANKNVTILE